MARSEGDKYRYMDRELSDDVLRGVVELTPAEIEDADETIKRIGINKFFKKQRMD